MAGSIAGGQMIELIKHEISLPEFIGKTTTGDNCGPALAPSLGGDKYPGSSSDISSE